MHTLPDIQHKILIHAPIQQVWDQISTAEGISAWFMPNDLKAETGHRFHLQSPFGPSPCQVTEVDPSHRLSFQWDTDGWFVTFELRPSDGSTEFTLIHGGWKQPDATVPKAGEDAAVIRERMSGGWVGILNKLRETVEKQKKYRYHKQDRRRIKR